MGVAHFLEHLLFLGSHKYPDKDYYDNFICHHGGEFNAYTDDYYTCYYFMINSEYFNDAVDILSRFFIDPLLTNEWIEKEMNAVNNEYKMNLVSDAWREYSVIKTLVNPSHPFSKFSIGNNETLNKPNIFEKVKELYSTLYSSNNMKLCLVGNQTLDELEQLAKSTFEQVPNKNVNISRNYPELFNYLPKPKPNPNPQLVKIVSIKNTHNMKVQWVIPKYENYYKSMPIDFIINILGHECEGSLADVLKKVGWIESLNVGISAICIEQHLFYIHVTMTNMGINYSNEISNIFYQYIKLLYSSDKSVLYEDIRKLNIMNWMLESKNSVCTCSSNIACLMLDYPSIPIDNIINNVTLCENFNLDTDRIINYFLDFLTPANSFTTISSPIFVSNTNLKEKWFDTEYSIDEINLLSENNSVISNIVNNFKLPIKNIFIPTDLNFVNLPELSISNYPTKLLVNQIINDQIINDPIVNDPIVNDPIVNDPIVNSEIWYKPITKYQIPKAYALIYLEIVNESDKYKYIHVILECIKESLNIKLNSIKYYAELANYSCSISVNNGLLLEFYGMSEGLTEITNKFANLDINVDNTIGQYYFKKY